MTHSYKYWLANDEQNGKLYLWSECSFPDGHKEARGTPIDAHQLRWLNQSLQIVEKVSA